MPNIDLTDVIEDDDLSDLFDVRRRDLVVGDNGRGQVSERLHSNIVGIVTPGDPGNIMRKDDASVTSRVITITTKFRLRGTGENFQPDEVFYDGVVFTVKAVKLWNRLGSGFIKAVAESGASYDPPPV